MKLLRYVLIVLGICALCSCKDNPSEAEISTRRLLAAYPQLELDKLTNGNGYIVRDSVSNRTFYFSATYGSRFDNPDAYDRTRFILCLYDWQEVFGASPGLHRRHVYLEDLGRYFGTLTPALDATKEK